MQSLDFTPLKFMKENLLLNFLIKKMSLVSISITDHNQIATYHPKKVMFYLVLRFYVFPGKLQACLIWYMCLNSWHRLKSKVVCVIVAIWGNLLERTSIYLSHQSYWMLHKFQAWASAGESKFFLYSSFIMWMFWGI